MRWWEVGDGRLNEETHAICKITQRKDIVAMDNRRAILIGSCIEAAATLVAAGKFGDEETSDYPADAVATMTRILTDELLHDAVVASAEFLPKEGMTG